MNQPDPNSPYAGEPPVERPTSVQVTLPSQVPYISYILLGMTILVYLLQMGTESYLGFDLPRAVGIKANELIQAGQYWRLFTPMLLHGSVTHILVNMYALYMFGPGLEQHFGHTRFLALYLLSGFAGNVISFTFSPAYSLGSSTAIFGLLGAQGVFLYQNRQLFGKNAQRALGNIILIGVVNLVIGLSPGIDNWGHIGGLLGGTAFTWFGGPVLQVRGYYPELRLQDEREPGDTLRAAAVVGLLFIALAVGIIFLRGA